MDAVATERPLSNLAAAYEAFLAKAAAEQAKVAAQVVVAAQAPAEQEKIVVAQAAAATTATELDEAEIRVLIQLFTETPSWPY